MAVAPALTDACSITPGTKPDPLQRRPMQGAFGTASYELGVPMSPQLRMPIASNTKLITSVALHQLQEQVREGQGRCARCAMQALVHACIPAGKPAVRTVAPGQQPVPGTRSPCSRPTERRQPSCLSRLGCALPTGLLCRAC